MQIAKIVSQPFAENTYIAHLDGRDDCLVIDPGFEPDAILQFLTERRLTPAAILNTHGHLDHIAGNSALQEQWPNVPLVIGRNEAEMLTDPAKNLSLQYGFEVVSPPADVLLDEGETYAAAGMEFEIREIPGHSPGHIVFVHHGHSPVIVFGGDVLFEQGVGRTDTPGGSMKTLVDGIRQKLFTLPDDTVVLPGHGNPTTTGQEKRWNPFVGEQ